MSKATKLSHFLRRWKSGLVLLISKLASFVALPKKLDNDLQDSASNLHPAIDRDVNVEVDASCL
jgi:hypothetical protein